METLDRLDAWLGNIFEWVANSYDSFLEWVYTHINLSVTLAILLVLICLCMVTVASFLN